MKYRYTDDQGRPLQKCPECGHSLTNTGGILIVLSDGFDLSWQQLSFLDDVGDLVDPTGSIDAGMAWLTVCGGCEEALNNLEGVNVTAFITRGKP